LLSCSKRLHAPPPINTGQHPVGNHIPSPGVRSTPGVGGVGADSGTPHYAKLHSPVHGVPSPIHHNAMVAQGQFLPQHSWPKQHPPHNTGTPLGHNMGPTSTPVVGGLDEVPKNRGSVLVPCRARGMPMDHNFKTAHFVIPENIEHGAELLCSYLSCRNAGVKFRFCTVCQVPVAKRNFRKRHMHANGDNADDKLSDEEVDISAFARPCTPKQLASPGTDVASGTKRSWSGTCNIAEKENEKEWASLLLQRPSTDDNGAMNEWLLKVLTVSDAAKRLKKSLDKKVSPKKSSIDLIDEVNKTESFPLKDNKDNSENKSTTPKKSIIEISQSDKNKLTENVSCNKIETKNLKSESNNEIAGISVRGNSANQDIHAAGKIEENEISTKAEANNSSSIFKDVIIQDAHMISVNKEENSLESNTTTRCIAPQSDD